MVDSKIEETKNYIIMMKTDQTIKELAHINTREMLQKILEKANKIIIGDIGFNSPDDYLKYVLEKKDNDGTPVAY